MNATTYSHADAPVLTDSGRASNVKPLWAAIGVLGVCVLALGASLVHVNKRPAEPAANIASTTGVATVASKLALAPQSLASLPDDPVSAKPIEKPVVTKEKTAQAAPKVIAKHTPQHASAKVVTQPAAQPVAGGAGTSPAPGTGAPVVVAQAPAPAPAKAVCSNCGTVESVTPVLRDGKAGPAGVIAGGVVGGLLGNQVGKGDGRVLGTVLGAAGGAWAGNTIEKKIKKETVYAVRVRMEDGNTRTIEQATAPNVGAKVTVDGSTLASQ